MRLIILMIFLMALVAVAKAQTRPEVIHTITREAVRAGLDPDLAVAIAMVESGLNPRAVGALKEQGLYQLRPEFHSLNGGPDNNVKVGIRYLVQIRQKKQFRPGWFVFFNCGPNRILKDPTKTRYYKKVMNVFSTIKVNRYLIAEN